VLNGFLMVVLLSLWKCWFVRQTTEGDGDRSSGVPELPQDIAGGLETRHRLYRPGVSPGRLQNSRTFVTCLSVTSERLMPL
jgi:hypothetical protein